MSVRDKILSADDVESESVHVPEWGVDLVLRSPSVAERATLIQGWQADDETVDIKAMYVKLLIATAHDENGEPVFSSKDEDALAKKNGRVVHELFEKAQRISGLAPEDVKEKKGVSSTIPSVGTSST